MTERRAHPIAFKSQIQIAADCARVYAALDMASPLNRFRARGMSLVQDNAATDRYALINPALPDVTFTLTEVEAEPHHLYHSRTEFPYGEPIGVLLGDESSYRLAPHPDGGCQLNVTGLFMTLPLTDEEREAEAVMLEISVHDDLARLKALIEEGAEAAETAGAIDDILG